MKLSDDDKNTLIYLLKHDLPIPSSYASLLFPSQDGFTFLWDKKDLIEPVTKTSFTVKEEFSFFYQSIDAMSDDVWNNTLIQGDNLQVLHRLCEPDWQQKISKAGGIKLIYVDPPFDVGDSFSMHFLAKSTSQRRLRLGKDFAYSDKWGKERSAFVHMLYQRLLYMHKILADDGSIFVHCDWRTSAYTRLLLDEIFGKAMFRNEIIWHYTGGGRSQRYFSRKHDSIFWYSKSAKWTFRADALRLPYKSSSAYARRGIVSSQGKRYMPHPEGTLPDDVWDIPIINPLARERVGYPTQKPLALLERIIEAASSPGDIVADFFCGSGTSLVAASKLARRWLGVDMGHYACSLVCERLLQMQQEFRRPVELASKELDEGEKRFFDTNLAQDISHGAGFGKCSREALGVTSRAVFEDVRNVILAGEGKSAPETLGTPLSNGNSIPNSTGNCTPVSNESCMSNSDETIETSFGGDASSFSFSVWHVENSTQVCIDRSQEENLYQDILQYYGAAKFYKDPFVYGEKEDSYIFIVDGRTLAKELRSILDFCQTKHINQAELLCRFFQSEQSDILFSFLSQSSCRFTVRQVADELEEKNKIAKSFFLRPELCYAHYQLRKEDALYAVNLCSFRPFSSVAKNSFLPSGQEKDFYSLSSYKHEGTSFCLLKSWGLAYYYPQRKVYQHFWWREVSGTEESLLSPFFSFSQNLGISYIYCLDIFLQKSFQVLSIK